MESLSREALLGVAKAHILREGTEYGHRDFELSEKLDSVLSQLRRGKAVLVYNASEECCHILLRDEWLQYQKSTEVVLARAAQDEH